MRTELQFQKPDYRKVTSQFPRNRHSVAAWMAELDRQRGERIRDLREAHAWTQRQVADKLGVDPKSVHNWEAGREINPTNLRELAEVLSVTPDYIRFGEREVPDLTQMLSDGNNELQDQLDRIETNQQQILAELRAAAATTRDAVSALDARVTKELRAIGRKLDTGARASRTQRGA